MPTPTVLSDLSKTASSNFPAGTDSPAIVDDVLRAHASFIAQLYGSPTFRATLSADQVIANGATNKIAFNVETFDVGSCYDNSVNYRFTPNVAGYYLVQTKNPVTSSGGLLYSIYKNGSSYSSNSTSTQTGNIAVLSDIVYLNGSTDYVEIFGSASGASVTVLSGATFYATLVRLA